MGFSERLYQTRKKKKVTQTELAKACNVSRQTISNYENGKYFPKTEVLFLLADYLHVDFSYLMEGKEKKEATYDDLMTYFLYLVESELFMIKATNKEIIMITNHKIFMELYQKLQICRKIYNDIPLTVFQKIQKEILLKYHYPLKKINILHWK